MKPEIGAGSEHTLHRNPLLPRNMLVDTDGKEKSQNRKQCIRAPKSKVPKAIEREKGESDTDSEDFPIFLPVFQAKRIATRDHSSEN